MPRWTSDPPLWDLYMSFRDKLERFADLDELAEHLNRFDRDQAENFLRAVRADTILLLKLPADEREAFLQTLGREDWLLHVWALAFWSAKASILVEALGDAGLSPDTPHDQSVELSLVALDRYERELVLLWPFRGQSPFWREEDQHQRPANDED